VLVIEEIRKRNLHVDCDLLLRLESVASATLSLLDRNPSAGKLY